MTATCKRCGETWPRDPALEVPCPQCQAPVGVKCRRPSGHPCELHHGRDQRAMDEGFLRPCRADQASNQAAGQTQGELAL